MDWRSQTAKEERYVKIVRIIAVVSLLLIAGCASPEPEPLPTYTPYPTLAPLPTYTPVPTPTEPSPTNTQALPTSISVPTSTSVPTNTPVPPTSTTIPTETAAPPTVAPPTPTSGPVGLSRSNPYPPDEMALVPNWSVRVLETVRGEEAWQIIAAANPYNDPPPEGMEYLLVKIDAKCTYDDIEQHSMSESDFKLTGDRLVRYSSGFAAGLEPDLSAQLLSGGETEGWVAFLVGQGEGSLILIVDEFANWDDDRLRFIALEGGTSIQVSPELQGIEPTYTELSRSMPVPLGDTVATEDWEITVLEVVKGDEAWAMVKDANQFNDPPKEGMQYVAIRVCARYIGTEDEPESIDDFFFNVTGDGNVVYPVPYVINPWPALDVYLYPGGECEGWVVEQAAQGEANLMAVFEPTWSFKDTEKRFLALEEGASIAIPSELAGIEATTIGRDLRSPAQFGETVTLEDWQVTLLDVVRGNEAWQMAQEANQFNDPPEEGMEYLAVKVHVRYVGAEDESVHIDAFAFTTTGSAKTIHDLPSVVEPEPAFGAELFPGGEHEGWAILQIGTDETGLIAIFEPLWSFGSESRFLSLEP